LLIDSVHAEPFEAGMKSVSSAFSQKSPLKKLTIKRLIAKMPINRLIFFYATK
jgi:hypothetical protein